MFLLLCMLALGMFSLLERVLLATVQYRQGPVAIVGHGSTQAVSDGIKLYSKYSTSVFAYGTGHGVLAAPLAVIVGFGVLVSSVGLLCLSNLEADT